MKAKNYKTDSLKSILQDLQQQQQDKQALQAISVLTSYEYFLCTLSCLLTDTFPAFSSNPTKYTQDLHANHKKNYAGHHLQMLQ